LTVTARATSPTKPWNANSHPNPKRFGYRTAFDDLTDDFVAGDKWQFRMRQFSVDDVEIGSTNGAG
jgi:hypothetical protein